jgi:zinc transport system substrate-binding protein
MIRNASLCLALAALSLSGCTRNAADAKPTVSAGVPPVVTVATVDFPSTWVAEQVGGDAGRIERISAPELASSDADLIAYVPGLDPTVDAELAMLPQAHVVDLTADVGQITSPRDPQTKDPFVWFDPVNVATMAQTLGEAMARASATEFEAYQYYGLRALNVQAEALAVDQRLQEQFNPCRIPTLVVEAPVLTYLARAYAFTQVPLIAWKPSRQQVEAVYYTLDGEPAVRAAASANGVIAVPVDTLTESAPEEDLLQGIIDLGDEIAAHQDCPLVTPSASDRPG